MQRSFVSRNATVLLFGYKAKRLAALALLILLVTFAACDISGNCGPFADKFKTTSFVSEIRKVEHSDSPGSELILRLVEDDTLSYDAFAILMTPIIETYFSSAQRSRPLTLIPAAYACSPSHPSSDEVIRDIQIYSSQAFDREHAAGENLADLFDIVVMDRTTGAHRQRFDLNDFLASAPTAVDEIILVLDARPQMTAAFEFEVKYFQEGAGLRYYEYKTEAVVLRAE